MPSAPGLPQELSPRPTRHPVPRPTLQPSGHPVPRPTSTFATTAPSGLPYLPTSAPIGYPSPTGVPTGYPPSPGWTSRYAPTSEPTGHAPTPRPSVYPLEKHMTPTPQPQETPTVAPALGVVDVPPSA